MGVVAAVIVAVLAFALFVYVGCRFLDNVEKVTDPALRACLWIIFLLALVK